jgi:hypothetical protein
VPLVVVAVGGVPGVQAGLGERGRGLVAVVQPGQEPVGLGELLGGVGAGADGQGSGGGLGAQLGELVPGAELVQQPGVAMVGELGEALVEPGLEVQQLLVHDREHAAGHE